MNYKKLYLNLFNAITDAINSITDVQCQDEENFIRLFKIKESLMYAQQHGEDAFLTKYK